MTRVETLLEQASVLRTLADSFDDELIRADLLRAAERCEDLAKRIAAGIEGEAVSPKSEAAGIHSTPTDELSTD